jgi:N-methylhydantoinase B
VNAAALAADEPARRVDPVTLEVVRNAVYAIAEEMRVVIMRSARSPLLKEAGDLSCVLTDAHGRLIAQGNLDIPIHLGVMSFTVKELLKRVPAAAMHDGDVYFTNGPAVGGNHLPDVKAIRPIYFEDQLVAFAVNLSHWPDVGGALPGSYVPWATQLIQEGLHIPPLRLFDHGGPIAETIGFLLRNVRNPVEREGDIYAQRAATEIGAQRLAEVFQQFGAATVRSCFERMLEESDHQMRAAIAAVPHGVYEGEDFLDDDGQSDRPVRIHVRVSVRGDEVAFDFAGTDPQVRGPLNTTYYVVCSAVYYTCKALLGPSIPPNDGCYRALTVHVPKGTVLNPSPDAPVVAGNHETSQRVVDALFKAWAQAIPERVVAGGITTGGVVVLTGTRHDGTPFVFYEVHGGGEGASSRRDGLSATRVHTANTMNTPVEAIEHEYPLVVERHELREHSGGAGRRRGGLGYRRRYRIQNQEAILTTIVERCRVAPWGLFGGEDGRPSRVTLERDGSTVELAGKATHELRMGDVVCVETAGGGGYGPPAERPVTLAERDPAAGYV